MKKRFNTQSGYTLLFSVLVSVIVLGVAVFITSTARKQLILSSTARDSMYSFYMADSGIECASLAYKNNTLATSTPPSGPLTPISITCAGNTYTPNWQVLAITADDTANGFKASVPGSGTPSVYKIPNLKIAIPISAPGLPLKYNCASVTITAGQNTSNTLMTVIQSRGYNVAYITGFTSDGATGDCPQITSRTVERALRLIFYK